MIFYLLVLAVALTSIFGLVHSQTARDNLQLQRFFEWSVATLEQQFRGYDLSGILQVRNHAILENVEITPDESTREEPQIEEIQTAESIEEINGIRLNVDDENIEAQPEDQEDEEKVFAAISDSLRRLSAAASSGRINGAQIYGALLREALIHHEDRARNNNQHSTSDSPIICELPPETVIVASASEVARQVTQDRLLQQQQQGSCSNSSCPTSSTAATHIKSRIPKPAHPPGSPPSPATEKTKMYFGEEPLEYVPHQPR